MAYKTDILIIYAESDNKSKARTTGWVSNFHRFLGAMMVQLLGEKPGIVLKSDKDSLSGTNLKHVTTLIPVLSEAFIASPKCLKRLEKYQLRSNNASQGVFKILKKPVAVEKQPLSIRELTSFKFYQTIDAESGETAEYKDFFSPEAKQDFWMKMVDLAYGIHESLSMLKHAEDSALKNLFSTKSIYLAETDHTLIIERNIIKRELVRHGYSILPDQELPKDIEGFKRCVTTNLEESSLSIHLIGSGYGEIPEGSDRSIIELQNQLAAEKSVRMKGRSDFSRLVWITPDLKHANERQLAFVEGIKRDLTSTEGAEIMQTPLEDFKTIIREELIEVNIGKGLNLRHFNGRANNKAKAYLLYDKLDESDVHPIKDLMEKLGYYVLLPAFNGKLEAARQQHLTNLRVLDIAIIFQHAVDNNWVRMKLLDLFKAPGFGRKKPVQANIIFSLSEKTVSLDAHRGQNLKIINGMKKESMGILEKFVKKIQMQQPSLQLSTGKGSKEK